MTKTATLNFDDEHFVALNQGAQFDPSLTWEDGAGNPINIAAYSAKMQIRKKIGSDLVAEFSTVNGKIILTNLGVIKFLVLATETATLPAGNFIYDFKLFDGSGVPSILFRGSFIIKAAVTI